MYDGLVRQQTNSRLPQIALYIPNCGQLHSVKGIATLTDAPFRVRGDEFRVSLARLNDVSSSFGFGCVGRNSPRRILDIVVR